VRIRLSGLQLMSVGLDRGALVLDLVGPASRRRRRRHPFGGPVFTVRVPAGTFFDASLLRHLDDWTVVGTPLSLRATRRRRDGRLHRVALDDGCRRLSMRFTWPSSAVGSRVSGVGGVGGVSGRTARRRSAPGAAPAGATPPGSA
jgi:hypothetical protein